MSGREQILERVRTIVARRMRVEHPGDFGEWRPDRPDDTPTNRFQQLFEAAGGEVVNVPDFAGACEWLATFSQAFESVTIGTSVPSELAPALRHVSPDVAQLGISMAKGGVAETGSLVMDARDGRRQQLLVPTHVVAMYRRDMHATLREALASARDDLPSALGLHSGPSKSADIGQIMVRGVHGPGRVVALIIGDERTTDSRAHG